MGLHRGNYFAALPVRVPPEVLDAVKADAPPGLRWFHPDDLHITLAFFGREERSRLPAIYSVLSKIELGETSVQLGSLLLLPRPRTFTALSFKLRGDRQEISKLIEEWRPPLLVAAKCPPDVRPPLPHLTVVRPSRKDPAFDESAIAAWARSLPSFDNPVEVLPPEIYGWSADYAEADALGKPKFRAISPRRKTD